MRKSLKTLLGIEKDSQFSTRVIILSLPSALLFIALAAFKFLSPWMAFLCYAFIIVFNMFSLFPISYEMQILRNYVYSLSNERMNESKDMDFSEKDTKDLADAINSIHRFWTSKADTLEAQALSDAAVFDTLPDPIIMLDGEGNITGSNFPARRLLGEDILSRNIDKLFSTPIFINSIDNVLKNQSSSESLVFHAPEYNNRQ